MDGVLHFWSPPNPGEQILNAIKFGDTILVLTNDAVYVIMPIGEPLPNWVIQKISPIEKDQPG